MSASFTPGPWVVSIPTQSFEICTIHGVTRQPTEDGLGQEWVYVKPETMFRGDEWCWPDGDEKLANAYLIAAAPDLYEALKIAQLWLDVDGRFDMQRINAAIAKAEGRS